MHDDRGTLAQLGHQLGRIGDRPEVRIEDEIAVIRHQRAPILGSAHGDLGTQLLEKLLFGPRSERDDFHRDRFVSSQSGRELRLVDSDDLLVAGQADDLLAQHRRTPTLDHVAVRCYLVGAIESQVDDRMLLQGGQRNSQQSCLRQHVVGARDADDVVKLARPQ